MTLENLTSLFGWMALLNITILLIGSLAIIAIRDFATDIHARLFRLEASTVREAMYVWLGNYKVATFVFSIVPYLALRVMQA